MPYPHYQTGNTSLCCTDFLKPGGPLSQQNTYLANCQPNAEIAQATERSFINEMVGIMMQTSVITQSELQAFIASDLHTLQTFIQFINTMSQKDNAIHIYNDYISNPYYGMPATGPQAIRACKRVVYKPSNYQYATQGAVSSSTRLLKLNVSTIQNNLVGYKRAMYAGVRAGANAGTLNPSGQPVIPFLYKNKVQGCNQEIQIRYQNPKSCNNLPARPTQPALSSNYYAQSPVDPLA